MMIINMLVLEIGGYHPQEISKSDFWERRRWIFYFSVPMRSIKHSFNYLALCSSITYSALEQCGLPSSAENDDGDCYWRDGERYSRDTEWVVVKCLEQGGVRTEKDNFSDLINWTNIFWKRVWCDGILLDDCVKCIYTVRALQLNSH